MPIVRAVGFITLVFGLVGVAGGEWSGLLIACSGLLVMFVGGHENDRNGRR